MRMKFCRLLAVSLALMLLVSGVALAEDAGQPTRMARAYRSLILGTDYGDDVTYVIGHRHPDSDTVSAAIAYAHTS